MNSFRSKPVGWRGESYRHYLAAKGLKTLAREYTAVNPYTRDVRAIREEMGMDVSERPRTFKIGSTGFRYLPNSNQAVTARSWTPERHAAFKARRAAELTEPEYDRSSAMSQRVKELHLGNPGWKSVSDAELSNDDERLRRGREDAGLSEVLSQRFREFHLGNPDWMSRQNQRSMSGWTEHARRLQSNRIRVAHEHRRGEHDKFAEDMIAKLKREGLVEADQRKQ